MRRKRQLGRKTYPWAGFLCPLPTHGVKFIAVLQRQGDMVWYGMVASFSPRRHPLRWLLSLLPPRRYFLHRILHILAHTTTLVFLFYFLLSLIKKTQKKNEKAYYSYPFAFHALMLHRFSLYPTWKWRDWSSEVMVLWARGSQEKRDIPQLIGEN